MVTLSLVYNFFPNEMLMVPNTEMLAAFTLLSFFAIKTISVGILRYMEFTGHGGLIPRDDLGFANIPV